MKDFAFESASGSVYAIASVLTMRFAFASAFASVCEREIVSVSGSASECSSGFGTASD